jgi:hypothetical protein
MFLKHKNEYDIKSFYNCADAYFAIPHFIQFNSPDELSVKIFSILNQPIQLCISDHDVSDEWRKMEKDKYYIDIRFPWASVQEFWDNNGFLHIAGGQFCFQLFPDYMIVDGFVPNKSRSFTLYNSEIDCHVCEFLHLPEKSGYDSKNFYNAVWHFAQKLGAAEMLLTNEADLEFIHWHEDYGFSNKPITYQYLKTSFANPATNFEDLEERLSGDKLCEEKDHGVYWKAACMLFTEKPFKEYD